MIGGLNDTEQWNVLSSVLCNQLSLMRSSMVFQKLTFMEHHVAVSDVDIWIKERLINITDNFNDLR